MLNRFSLNQIGNLLFAFRGRINRAKYWLATLISFIWMVICICIIALGSFAAPSISAIYLLAFLAVIPFLVASLAISIKRLHDRDKNGWWLVLFYFVPTVFDRLGDGSTDSDVGSIFFYLCEFAISIWAFVEIGCLRGTLGPNRYGPDPLSSPADVFD